ncbi:hypothetical protein A9G24_08735 [Gilliamella sp. App6-5]|uniref:tight adherence pilus pseudopilin TadF n=1 Tax=Gilliamella sp. App6-5 TaxID=3120232 RepID=UPI00080E6105|nr:tight adherence pilus pseudopilin TadF [Gilliamella apicola]OCG12200.1 hypothetical protein A9G24_08735 [Gilliamella apicola]
MKSSGNFFHNKDGIISIEFAACFCLFTVLLFIIYDVYSTIMLQNRLERANYAVASIFRERSSLYPIINGTIKKNKLVLCSPGTKYCFKTHELFDDNQVEEMRLLATKLLGGRDVSIRVDGLFIVQNTHHPESLSNAQLHSLSSQSCPIGSCNNAGIANYFNSLPRITDNSSNNYSKLVPYVSRVADPIVGLAGRWIPLYRVSMCVVNEESFYLKWINSSREADDTFPNLCSNIVVLSRCNSITDAARACPIYYL